MNYNLYKNTEQKTEELWINYVNLEKDLKDNFNKFIENKIYSDLDKNRIRWININDFIEKISKDDNLDDDNYDIFFDNNQLIINKIISKINSSLSESIWSMFKDSIFINDTDSKKDINRKSNLKIQEKRKDTCNIIEKHWLARNNFELYYHLLENIIGTKAVEKQAQSIVNNVKKENNINNLDIYDVDLKVKDDLSSYIALKTDNFYTNINSSIEILLNIDEFNHQTRKDISDLLNSSRENNPFDYYKLINYLHKIPKLKDFIEEDIFVHLKMLLIIDILFLTNNFNENSNTDLEETLFFHKLNLIEALEKNTFKKIQNLENMRLWVIQSKFKIDLTLSQNSNENFTRFSNTNVYKYLNRLYINEPKLSISLANLIIKNIRFFINNDDIELIKILENEISKKNDFIRFSKLLKEKFSKEISKDEIIFLIKNNFINPELLKKEINLKVIYLACTKYNFNLEDINKLQSEKIEKLNKSLLNIEDCAKYLIYSLEDKNIDELISMKRIQKNIENDLIFLEKESIWYKELKDLLDNSWDLELNILTKKINDIYSKNWIIDIINKNKWLIWDKNPKEYLEHISFIKSLKIKSENKKDRDDFIKKLFSCNEEIVDFYINVLFKKDISKNISYQLLNNSLSAITKKSHLIKYMQNNSNDDLDSFINSELNFSEKKIMENEISNYVSDNDLIEIVCELWEERYRIIRKIFHILDNEEDISTFILAIDSNISEIQLNNFFKLISFIKWHQIKIDLNNLFEINIIDKILEILETKFNDINCDLINQDIHEFNTNFIEYIKTWDDEFINKYFIKINEIKKEDYIKNDIDKNINEIIESNNEDNIKELSENINKYISYILNNFSSGKVSSTRTNNWRWSGSYTRKLDNFLQIIHKRKDETNLEHLNRIQFINWYQIYNNNENDIRNSRLKNILNIIENKKMWLYDALLEFSNIISKIWVSDNEDLSNIKKVYEEELKQNLSLISFDKS